MTDFASFLVADRGQAARPIHLVDKQAFGPWLKGRSVDDRALLRALRFDGKSEGAFAVMPRGNEFEVVVSVKDCAKLTPWCLAGLAAKLPAGTYRVADSEPGIAALGWLLGQHRFDAYRSKATDDDQGARVLLSGEPAKVEETVRLAEATALVRDLVDTPAADMGPSDLERVARDLATVSGAHFRVTAGSDLESGYPLIAAVGRAAVPERAPRLIELEWGRPEHPRVAIIGKGVCFDTGGLDLKPGSGMRQMKKDMGGAAHALALGQLITTAKLPVRLHLLVAAVENAISGAAYRPGDIVKSRKGLFVEVDNTDAEGRLILADALDRAAEDKPELIVDFATLTGAARIALGPDLPALFSSDDQLAHDIVAAGRAAFDPLWHMPLWLPYDEMLKSEVADLANASGSPMAGAVTAAMFLKRFVPEGMAWAHLDTYSWRDSAKPGRPKGGDALGLRAVFALLKGRYSSR